LDMFYKGSEDDLLIDGKCAIVNSVTCGRF